MKHVGDITQIHGWDLEPVDVICGGSPCQDISVSGLRAGLSGHRSALFHDYIRVVKEMRDHERAAGRSDEHLRPRFLVFENVAGLLSSGKPKGGDFKTVIEEFIKIVCPDVPGVEIPQRGWSKSGCFYDELGRWSIAWRVHDAQFWGVPQRRTRISLVADFGGLSAPEVLFERKGLCWYPPKSKNKKQRTATYPSQNIREHDTYVKHIALDYHPNDSRIGIKSEDICQTLTQRMGTGGGNVPIVLEIYKESLTGEHTTIRRLTPTEIERLQGFPDGWTDIGEYRDTSTGKLKKATDSARYRALGNSICIPYWKSLAKKISAQYDRDITIGSLFDGIGGFPYVFEQINGKGSAKWASEIDEFCIAVTKKHFPEE